MSSQNSENSTAKNEKIRDSSNDNQNWITSGRFGTKDAVLLFRAEILSTLTQENWMTLIEREEENVNTTYENQKPSPELLTNISHIGRGTGGCVEYNIDTSSICNDLGVGKDEATKREQSKKSSNNENEGKTEEEEDTASTNTTNINENNENYALKLNILNEITAADETKDDNEKADDENSEATDDETDKSDSEAEPDILASPYQPNMPAIKLRITYKFMNTETELLRIIFQRHGLEEAGDDEGFTILWTGVLIKPDILRSLASFQRVNHFPRSYELTRKDRLYKNIVKMQRFRGSKNFEFMPTSFILPNEMRELISTDHRQRGPWICKPTSSSRGRGIFIVKSPSQIPEDEQLLVSRYVCDPLCIEGHKCDLRVYVLVTSFNPLIIYLYNEGIVRLATVKYELQAENLWNPCMHLCNYSINKFHTDYKKSLDGQSENVGHKWTLSALLRHLKEEALDTEQLMLDIEDLIIKSFMACAQPIISACRMFVPYDNNCFELYGFDILVDDQLKPWLLEINLSPSIGIDSPLDAKVKACLLADTLNCVGIPAYSPRMREFYTKQSQGIKKINSARSLNDQRNAKIKSGADKHKLFTENLHPDEERMIQMVLLQNQRRGGFIRIFPRKDSMQRYGSYLDQATGIPLSTPITAGQVPLTTILTHNYNQVLYYNFYGRKNYDEDINLGDTIEERLRMYETPLEVQVNVPKKKRADRDIEQGQILYKKITTMLDAGHELTQLQMRQAFAAYLELILARLVKEPHDFHERLIMKFLSKMGGVIKTPKIFRNSRDFVGMSKVRSAMVAKYLGDFLSNYNHVTESIADAGKTERIVPANIFDEFLLNASENNLESILKLYTAITKTMPYLYNKPGAPVPPIPSGAHGFLKALPAMVLLNPGVRQTLERLCTYQV